LKRTFVGKADPSKPEMMHKLFTVLSKKAKRQQGKEAIGNKATRPTHVINPKPFKASN